MYSSERPRTRLDRKGYPADSCSLHQKLRLQSRSESYNQPHTKTKFEIVVVKADHTHQVGTQACAAKLLYFAFPGVSGVSFSSSYSFVVAFCLFSKSKSNTINKDHVHSLMFPLSRLGPQGETPRVVSHLYY